MRPRRAKFHFYCDENFPLSAGEFLRSKGHKVLFAQDCNKPGLSDYAQLAFAKKNSLTFLTIDKDFKNYNFPSERVKTSPGIVIVQTDVPTKQNYERILQKMLSKVTPNQIIGSLCIISTTKIELLDLERRS